MIASRLLLVLALSLLVACGTDSDPDGGSTTADVAADTGSGGTDTGGEDAGDDEDTTPDEDTGDDEDAAPAEDTAGEDAGGGEDTASEDVGADDTAAEDAAASSPVSDAASDASSGDATSQADADAGSDTTDTAADAVEDITRTEGIIGITVEYTIDGGFGGVGGRNLTYEENELTILGPGGSPCSEVLGVSGRTRLLEAAAEVDWASITDDYRPEDNLECCCDQYVYGFSITYTQLPGPGGTVTTQWCDESVDTTLPGGLRRFIDAMDAEADGIADTCVVDG